MSESRFIESELAEFRRRYPASEGWRVFRTSPHGAHALTTLLPALLRSDKDAQVLREEIATAVAYFRAPDGRRDSLTEAPFERRGKGLDESSWFGEIDFLWHGSPVHYRRVAVMMQFGETSTAMIATKGRKVMESVYAALVRLDRRLHPPRRMIRVFEDAPIPRPKLTWEDVILPAGMTDDIRTNVDSFFQSKARYKKLGIPFRRGLLFSGPPGNGKTLTARVIASRVPATVFILPLKADMEDRNLHHAFRSAADQAPALMIIEDLDRLPAQAKVSMSYLLNLLDGFSSAQGVMVIATTNAPEKLDAALLNRPSRFDRVWQFGLPGAPERERLLRKVSNGYFSAQTLAEAAQRSSGFTMAYAQEAVVSALLRAATDGKDPVEKDLFESIDRLKTQLRTNGKADGALKTTAPVGFELPGGNGNGNGKKDLPKGTEV